MLWRGSGKNKPQKQLLCNNYTQFAPSFVRETGAHIFFRANAKKKKTRVSSGVRDDSTASVRRVCARGSRKHNSVNSEKKKKNVTRNNVERKLDFTKVHYCGVRTIYPRRRLHNVFISSWLRSIGVHFSVAEMRVYKYIYIGKKKKSDLIN